MQTYSDEQIRRFEAVIDELTSYADQPTAPMFADLLGAVRYLSDLRAMDTMRVRTQAREIMDLHAQLSKDSQYDPLGRGAIVELIDRVPLLGGNSYFSGGQVGVVEKPRFHYNDGYTVGLRFPGFTETYEVSSLIVRVIRRPEHASGQ